jgi:uncharacterized membrane protein
MRFPPLIVRHHRFYSALACGAVAWAACWRMGLDYALLAGGDVFYLLFLALCAPLTRQKASDLKRLAKTEDEGAAIVVVITLATMVFFAVAVFLALNSKHSHQVLPLVLAGIGAPLGWLVLHTVMAFHYANLHYFVDADGDPGPDLDFPGKDDPDPWDFLYFSFVIGMTAQVSDVAVRRSAMRRTVLLHGVASFFFNTVFIAMAVNAGVALAA